MSWKHFTSNLYHVVRHDAYDASMLFHFDLCWPSPVAIGTWHKQTVWTQVTHERHPTDQDPNQLTAEKTWMTRHGIILHCSGGLVTMQHLVRVYTVQRCPYFCKWIKSFKDWPYTESPAGSVAQIFPVCVQNDIVFVEMQRVQNLVRCQFKASDLFFCSYATYGKYADGDVAMTVVVLNCIHSPPMVYPYCTAEYGWTRLKYTDGL